MEKVKAVRGSSERDSEVRKWLESQGAKINKYPCTNPNHLYFVAPDGHVEYLSADSAYAFLLEEYELPRWRADRKSRYYYITSEGYVTHDSENFSATDSVRWDNKNYFATCEEVKEYLQKIKKLFEER